ncbi:MAG: phosphotransferase [Microthrixaceae bacterium]|nr:phosphotransferase [Microthrixaceae bacterium]
MNGQPTGVPADLVVRVVQDGPMGAKELAVQRAVAGLGFNTPAVRLAGAVNGHKWSVMDFAAGSPPLTGMNGLAALRRAPMVLRQLPSQLATPLAELHQLDPMTVTEAVRNAAPSVVWTVEDLLVHFKAQAELLGRSQLALIAGRLSESRPSEDRRVVCHGDYHPFNLLVSPGSPTVVVDWTGSLLAEPVYDLAFTTLLLEHPPLDAPGPFGSIIGGLGRRLATRFLDAYQSVGLRADLAQLGWYRGLHGLRVLIELASMEHHHSDRVSGHPFNTLRSAAEAAVVDEIGPINGGLG